jgi:hypothetical protein
LNEDIVQVTGPPAEDAVDMLKNNPKIKSKPFDYHRAPGDAPWAAFGAATTARLLLKDHL